MSRTDTNTLTVRDTDTEFHAASATAHLLDELQLCGHRPGRDELTRARCRPGPARRRGRSP